MSRPEQHLYEFGHFRLNIQERLLLRDGVTVALTPKVFDTLLVLVRHGGHLVEKDELMHEVWPESFVEEVNLSVNVSALRKALGEHESGLRYIETVPKRGYRFVAPVKEVWDEVAEQLLVKRTRATVTINEEESLTEDAAPDVVPVLAPQVLPASREKSRVAMWGSRHKLIAASLLSIALMVTLYYAWSFRARRQAAKSPEVKSIAVLPFMPVGTPGDDEYLGLGMADALIARLGRIKQLSVRPTSAVQKYAGLAKSPVFAGSELQAESVLHGTWQRTGDRLRVTVQLIRVRDHVPIWAETYDEKLTDIPAMQDSIAQRITEVLELRLSGDEEKRLKGRYTQNAAAYEAYMKGRFFLNKRQTSGFQKAMQYFQQAIDLDPNYALAYAGLADANNMGGHDGERFASKALELDETLGEPHASLGFARMFRDLDWVGSEREFKQAIELNPNYATAHQWYSINLEARGHLDEAEVEMRRAHEIDPLSLPINADLGQLFYFQRKYDQAIEQLRRTLEIDPDFQVAHRYLFLPYAKKGMFDEAVTERLKAETLDGGNPARIASLRDAYASGGTRGFLLKMISWEQKENPGSVLLAASYALLGDKEHALSTVEQTCDLDFFRFEIKPDPVFDGLRAEPRFIEVERRMGVGTERY